MHTIKLKLGLALMFVVLILSSLFAPEASATTIPSEAVTAITTNPVSTGSIIAMAGATGVSGDLKNVKYEKFILKKFRHVGTWLQEVSSKQSWVNNDVIKIPKRGGTPPKVLINNTVYPIQSNRRDDDHVVVALNKYDTENRIVTDDELHAIAYDKEGDINLELKEELEEATINHGLHSISPSEHDVKTPILMTTGPEDGTGRPRLIKKDLIDFKLKLTKAGAPLKGRILVLCPEHAADLMIEDSTFEKGYHNRKDGVIAQNYYGFKVYEELWTPAYDKISNELLPFDSLTEGKNSSIAFHKKSTAKASGSVTRYAKKASEDPDNRQSKLGYRKYFGVFAISDQGMGAIIDGTV